MYGSGAICQVSLLRCLFFQKIYHTPVGGLGRLLYPVNMIQFSRKSALNYYMDFRGKFPANLFPFTNVNLVGLFDASERYFTNLVYLD